MNKERENTTYLEEKEVALSAKELYEKLYLKHGTTNPIRAKFMVFLEAKRRSRQRREELI